MNSALPRTFADERSYIPVPPAMLADYYQLWLTRLRSLQSHADFLSMLEYWRPLVADILPRALALVEEEFQEFLQGFRAETAGEYAGPTWSRKYRWIIFPEILMCVDIIAEQWDIPWGVAYNRLEFMSTLITDRFGNVTINPEAPKSWL